MAILTKAYVKDGAIAHRRLYFAHIPKTAGSSLYLAFLRDGWMIENVRLGNQAEGDRAVINEFGIKKFQQYGTTGNLRRMVRSIQHAPYDIWHQWGPFEQSFAIVRHPVDRYVSALKYHHRHGNTGGADLDDSRRRVINAVRRGSWSRKRRFDGHFAPQVQFVGPETNLYRFEEDFAQQISDDFGFADGTFPSVNEAPPEAITLTQEELDLIRAVYAEDFETFGYTPPE
ncbi:sulfotransferase family 2 domain-containing protein [Yoonia litorea]|uniref:Sulfotransferase family protein n=1 Tax=Yoonia litorea TaxID=1123755 RepID=A0A1I6LW86_9RHOB|nr:sulfotransferase family 2 domain-containing protein [Yoonia litorea]SFS07693.1 Sulfotransferase family protein [Yoonia litorea]